MKILVFNIFLVFSSLLNAQESLHDADGSSLIKGPLPRNKENYDKPGNYEIAVTTDKTEINKGEGFKVQAFMTGYGAIRLSKVFINFSSTNIFDTTSEVLNSLGVDNEGPLWGADKYITTKSSIVIGAINGLPYKREDSTGYYDSYVDVNSQSEKDATILTEMVIRNAPITLNLKVKDDCESGNYNINFYFTYFNGQEWKTSKEVVDFKVNNFFEQHSSAITIIGILGAILTLMPIVDGIVKYYNRLFRKKVKSVEPVIY